MIKRSDIFDKLISRENNPCRKNFYFQNERRRVIYSKVMSDYFKLMWTSVLSGNQWALPNKFGIISVQKKQIEHLNRIPFYKKHLLKGHENDRNERVFNWKTMDNSYQIVIESEYLSKYKCRFRAAPSVRRRLFDGLFHKNLSDIL